MRAITVRQPWAWAIVDGGKNIENRTRNIAGKYRGPVAIHAGQRFANWGGFDHRVLDTYLKAQQRTGIREKAANLIRRTGLQRDDLGDDYGVILGVVDLADVHEAYFDNGEPVQYSACTSDCEPWGEPGPGVHHLVLENPRPLSEPIPCRGMLGLWTPPEDITAQLKKNRCLR